MLVLCNPVAAMQSVVIFTAKYYGYLDRNRLNMIQQPAPRFKKKTITNNPKYIDVYKKPTIAPIKKPQKLNHKTNQCNQARVDIHTCTCNDACILQERERTNSFQGVVIF